MKEKGETRRKKKGEGRKEKERVKEREYLSYGLIGSWVI